MSEVGLLNQQVRVDGRLFRSGSGTFFVKGFAYGPFAPDANGVSLPSKEQIRKDFEIIKRLNANLLRVYHTPPAWFLDAVAEAGLRLLVDVPWGKHLYFLGDRRSKQEAIERIRTAARLCAGHPAVFGLSVANEFAPDLIRWSGRKQLGEFVNQLIYEAKSIAPEVLCTFSNYPTTEYLEADAVDFHSFNVYLHNPNEFRNYLARLENLTDGKPLLLTETGADSIRQGEPHQAEIIRGKLETIRHAGLAGAILFSYTDEWFTGGYPITDWAFGVVDAQRQPKPSAKVVQEIFAQDFVPCPKPSPKVSVIVATRNGGRTLASCLRSLERLEYPDYEVIVVNDGSTDDTEQIAKGFPKVKLINHPRNQGLSVARNTGLKAAEGEIIVYTDDDCRVNEHWLNYLCDGLIHSDCVAVGGPNYQPPEDSAVARAVMASPGGPAAVLLTDQIAEHIPGCNMAFWKWALEEIGGFDPIFMKAGDDVDVCWRIQQKGWKIAWQPAAFVWHARRNTVKAYLRQQYGYGEAESLLACKHPEYFNSLGACIWKGRIYATNTSIPSLGHSRVYHGIFGNALFQTLYSPAPAPGLLALTSLEYHIGITLPLILLSIFSHFFIPLAAVSLGASIATCILAACQQKLERPRWWSRPLVALLWFLQPIYRSYARYKTRLSEPSPPLQNMESLEAAALGSFNAHKQSFAFWIEKAESPKTTLDRTTFLNIFQDDLTQKGYIVRQDMGWDDFDLLIHGGFWTRLGLLTFCEPHKDGNAMLRIRFTTRWSSAFKTIWGLSIFFKLLLIASLHSVCPWIWTILILLPILPLWCRSQKKTLMRCVTSELLQFAGRHGLRLMEHNGSRP
ncbi:MAG: glycosyltransferase [Verrucomicrobia bacterium]|nr:glycosyltransferase [Verrucomicrobiota bacterium]